MMSKSQRRQAKAQIALSAGFAFVNGWIDAICLRRYHAFVTMMVGNTLTLGNSVGDFVGRTADDTFWDDFFIFRLPRPVFYIALIITFMFGVGLCRVLEAKRGWRARHFAPLVMMWILAHDVIEGFSLDCENGVNRWNALRLAPVFGIQDAISMKGGLSALPWCTTGNVITIAYTISQLMIEEVSPEAMQKFRVSVGMLLSMTLGAISGACFQVWSAKRGCGQGDYGIMVVAPALGILFWLHDMAFRPKTFADKSLSGFVHRSLLDTEEEEQMGA